ncbi:acyl-CoA dehydratase activase [Limnochorda pilosa]|uniref:2-hydroxyglutaryl-CoA dehydratase n=1 Tax=Limnochorda pilosa TaxID=1555112 RepID=A0A0K2SG96_LIMPI|nr:acyl-CoA dehydratase activase [Limnochorda pilosa]BAS26115.1 2-hydroxyglutaryl-CoA dehydratase [Limnochorda pilosa]
MAGTAGAGDGTFIGVDIGSATVKVAGVDRGGQMVGSPVYLRHDRFPGQVDAVKFALRQYLEQGGVRVAGVGTTGSGRELVRKVIGADVSRTEIFAHVMGIRHLVQQREVWTEGADGRPRPLDRIGTVLEIGGQDSKVVVFSEEGLPIYFNMNTICSAGTGEFLKQLADDAGIDLRDFGAIALRSTAAARIDATCTVFSKRDFRHMTQKGVALPDRLMGICIALVNNYMQGVVKNRPLPDPVVFQGGTAFNAAVRRAFERRLGTRVIVPPHNDVVGALGMAVIVRDLMLGMDTVATQFKDDFFERTYESQVRYCHGCQNACELTQPLERVGQERIVLDTMGGRCEGCLNPRNVKEVPQRPQEIELPIIRTPLRGAPLGAGGARVRASHGRFFAGIDGGSRGTKWAVVESLGEKVDVVAVGSEDTAGDAMGAILRAVGRIRDTLPDPGLLGGIGTTGSAGELARDMITTRPDRTADCLSTEILAHYTWAAHMVPGVGTIMDIGGNDLKIICVKETGLDFAMNDKCAAGSGSFVEAVARRFGVPLEEYAPTALESRDPTRIAGRCAVFGESDIVHKSRTGFPTRDLFMGLAFSICRTYLSDVARGKPIRLPVVAQGGTFLNEAVQEAFRRTLRLGPEEFIVASDRRFVLGAGALGAALLSKARFEEGFDSSFKGFERVLGASFRMVTTTCDHGPCPRRCQGVLALLEDGRPVAGYRSIDCDFGLFDGMITTEAARQRVGEQLEGVVLA